MRPLFGVKLCSNKEGGLEGLGESVSVNLFIAFAVCMYKPTRGRVIQDQLVNVFLQAWQSKWSCWFGPMTVTPWAVVWMALRRCS